MGQLKKMFPIIDGVEPSWADITVGYTPSPIAMPGGLPGGIPNVGGLLEMDDIYSITTSRSLDIADVRGPSGGRVMKGTTGQLSQEASITLYYSGYRKLYGNLAKVAPLRGRQRLISLVKFDIDAKWTPPGSIQIFQRIARGCRSKGDSFTSQEGPDAVQVEVPLWTVEVVDVDPLTGEEWAII